MLSHTQEEEDRGMHPPPAKVLQNMAIKNAKFQNFLLASLAIPRFRSILTEAFKTVVNCFNLPSGSLSKHQFYAIFMLKRQNFRQFLC